MSEGGINAPDNDTPINVLFSQFPKLKHETIRKIYYQDCEANENEAFVILTKLNQFNQALKQSNNDTVINNEGEQHNTPSKDSIENNIEGNNNTNNSNINNNQYSSNNNDFPDDCCGGCCSYKPNTYENGLYNRDMYQLISFLCLYAILNSPGHFVLKFFGWFVIVGANMIIVLLSLLSFCGKPIKSFVGYGFILIGIIYILTYAVSMSVSIRYARIIPRQYFIGIGMFIGLICIIIGSQLSNNIKFMNSRLQIVRVLLTPLLIYSTLAVDWYVSLLFSSCCIVGYFVIAPNTAHGGCNCLIGLGSVMWVNFFCICTYQYIVTRYSFFWFIDGELNDIFAEMWSLSPLAVFTANLWVLLKALHPCLARCNNKNFERTYDSKNDNSFELKVNSPNNDAYGRVNTI